jgi:1A family penicillin-binding protein
LIRNRNVRSWPAPSRALGAGDLTFRVILMPFVVLAAALLVAAGLFPLVGSAGRAVKLLDGQFLPNEDDPLKIEGFPLRSTIYASDGSVLAVVADYNRVYVPLKKVPEVAKRAIVAIEDHGFYEHGPVDFSSIMRAFIANLSAGQIVQGGSTITQQLVKNTETGNERTFARKWREAQDSIRLERTYTKDQILELYLNQVYLGHGAYGVGSAAEYYFGKSIRKLTLAESALLAGLIKAPSNDDPIAHKDTSIARRNTVLRRMLELNLISESEYLDAVAEPVKISSKRRNVNKFGPKAYDALFVQDQILHPVKTSSNDPQYKAIIKTFGKTYEERRRLLFQGGLKIYTTINPKLQSYARAAVEGFLPNPGNGPPSNPNASLATIVPQTGAVVAMYGGQNFSKHKINLATQIKRSAGSSFKAFTLAAAIEEGVPVGKVYNTSRVKIPFDKCPDPSGAWEPSNAEPGEGGFMNMARATAGSVNIYFAQLIADVGATNVQEMAKRMGVIKYARGGDVGISPVCSITLGAVQVNPLSMTSGYSTLANEGIHCKPFVIGKVLAANGKTIYKNKPFCQRVLDAKVSNQVTSLLQGVVSGGTGRAANIGRPQAGKTGTAQDYKDAWFMGYIPQMVTGVWVGYAYPKREIPMIGLAKLGGGRAFGGTLGAPIWHDFMIKAAASLPVKGFASPPPPKGGNVPNVVGMKQADAQKTLLKANFTPVVKKAPSTEPAGVVFDQSPKGGASASLGSIVTIFVSNGKAPNNPVPNVIGKTEKAAKKALRDAGFKVREVFQDVDDPDKEGIVLNQSPRGGKKAKAGSTVTIVVGRFVGPGPSP